MTIAITHPWRTADYPEGLPTLGATAAAKARKGNWLTRAAAAILSVLANHGADVADENPLHSWHWRQPVMVQLCSTLLVYAAIVDYCAFGEAWRKSTKIVGNKAWLKELTRRCPGCAKHVILRGLTVIDGKKVSRTSLAIHYPIALLREWLRLAKVYWSEIRSTEPLPSEDARDDHRLLRRGRCLDLNRTGAGADRILDQWDTARYTHVDDTVVLGASAVAVAGVTYVIKSALTKAGFNIGGETPVGEIERYIGYRSQQTPARWTLPWQRLAELDASLQMVMTWHRIPIWILRSLVGVVNWAFLLRRPMFSILFRTHQLLCQCDYAEMVPMVGALRRELCAVRQLLPLCFADAYQCILPIVMAQDAEGTSSIGHGGWGLGWSCPDFKEVINLATLGMARGIPSLFEQISQESGLEVVSSTLSDVCIPDAWTNGSTKWWDLLARAHSYPEHIYVYESRTLVRSLEIAAKIPPLHRSRLLMLEDNAVTVLIFGKGRSKTWALNQVCRRKMSLELASNISTAVAWVQSKRMPMGALSRHRHVSNYFDQQ